MSYDTWKCSPPDEEFETEACGHIVGTCVCDEAPVEEDGGIVAEVEITLGDIDQLQAFLEEHGELPRHGVEDGLLALARKALVRCVLHAGPDADADPDGLTYANAPTYAAEAERRRVVELERRDWAVRVLDKYASANACQAPSPCPRDRGRWWSTEYSLWDGSVWKHHEVTGDTADAARHAAALAVLPTLDAATRAELGECP